MSLGDDPFISYRDGVRCNAWVENLAELEVGELLSPDCCGPVVQLLPEEAMTTHLPDSNGLLTLIVSVPERQIKAFAEGQWRLGHCMDGDGTLVLVLVVGAEEPLECPFRFDLSDSQDVQDVIQISELLHMAFYGVTLMEEGVMLTLKGDIELPALLRQEVRDLLLAQLQ